MGFFLAILNWFGGGPLQTIADALTKAHADSLNAKTVSEKTAADERVATLTQAMADVANARTAASGQPWWMQLIAFMIGMPFALHILLIGVGTDIAAPLGWTWLEWTRHVPPFPDPYNTAELGIIGFFFGYASISGGLGAVAGAITRRK